MVEEKDKRKLYGKKIKFAQEGLFDVPSDWTDQQIENKLLQIRPYPYGAMIWCHYDEQLFDNPYINENYVEKPIPKGYKRVRVAHEQYRNTDWGWFAFQDNIDTAITRRVRCSCNVGRSFIWCWGDEELFKE